ncbi:MAG TPA: histidine kinase [Desulfobacteraceae bacterium]|nr:histidine kinase [Desulfobacteraceae bacterium]
MAQHHHLKFKTKLYLGYASILLLMILLAVTVYVGLTRLEGDRKWVNHSYKTIEAIQKCGALLVDMETGVRGFLVSGNEAFLEPYEEGDSAFAKIWEYGKELTRDNYVQTQRWEKLKDRKEKWQKTVAVPEITMRRKVREGEAAMESFEALSFRKSGIEQFNRIRDHLADLDKKLVRVGHHDAADLAMDILTDLVNQETGVLGFLLTGLEETLKPFEKGKSDFNRHYQALRDAVSGNTEIRADEILRIRTLVDEWHEKTAFPEIEARREVNKHPVRLKDVTALLEAGTGKRITDEVRQIVEEMVSEEKQLLLKRAAETRSTSTMTLMINVVGCVLATALGVLIAVFVVSSINRQLGTDPGKLAKIADDIALGDLSADLTSEKGEPTGVYKSVIQMAGNLKAVVQQAEAVSLGNFREKIALRSDKDQLGIALNRMTLKLKDAYETNEKDKFIRTGQAKLNEGLRGEQSLLEITDNTIRFLSEYLDAQVGAFYLLTDDTILELSASYAYQKRKNVSASFVVGEGLVGQAAREKKNILVSDIPEDYIHIVSGLGKTTPASILVAPILYETRLLGVIELASVKVFAGIDLEFFATASRGIAIAIQSARSRDQMSRLLRQTQNQAEELESQQEELKEANDILESQKKELLESQTRLQDQQEELRQTNEELEEQTQLLEEQKAAIQNKNVELESTRQVIEEKARDLELTSKYKSEFLANMSHELRTPLNSILLLSKLLADNKENTLTEKQQEYSQTIHMSGSELLELINEILDLSKVESGKMELHLEQVALSDMAQRFERSFKPQAMDKGLAFNVRIASDLPQAIRTDGQRLEQIIKNMISNALKFTATGEINLGIGRPDRETDLSAYDLEPENTIAFSVSDTGEGISPEKQKLIFEAFQQADGTTSRKYGGSGLGLSISRELSKLLGGTIRLDSEPGKGSTFTVYLPEVAEKGFSKPVEQPPNPPETSLAKERTFDDDVRLKAEADSLVEFIPDDRKTIEPDDKAILIIEDDPRFAKTLLDLAREREYKVLVAGNGETGLHFADYYAPDAVILDIELPGMDGWSVMDRLKKNPKTRHIPVHFISANDKSIEARKMGAIGFITKPVTLSLLDDAFEKIEHLISGDIRRLLVVEDDDVQRKAMVALIGNGDVVTTEAKNGEQAFALLRQQAFDCMILDLGLPDVSGIEFLTRIKEEEKITEIPIIVYTGKELTHEEEAIINEYAEKIIIKGVKSEEKLMDETTLFLHRIEANLPEEKQRMIRVLHDRESVFLDKKILVVDDDMRNVYAITNVLEDKGLTVIVAHNGQKGVDMLEKHPDTDLVLMDIMMPEMNGYEAIGIIRQDKRFKKLPIVALTAKAMRGDRKKCILAGASDYLAKPVNTDKLLSMMRVWLY